MSFEEKNDTTPFIDSALDGLILKIFACALVERTNAKYNSFANLGISSQYIASPVACLNALECTIGRPIRSSDS